MSAIHRGRKLVTIFEPSITKAATYAPAQVNLELAGYRELLITLDITVAERDTGNETYDFYITGGDGVSSWDIVHFPQIATTGAKRYTARVLSEREAEVTTATPGVAAEPTAIMKTDTAGAAEGTATLAAGKVRHGPFGNFFGYQLVVAGTVVTGIAYSITVTGD